MSLRTPLAELVGIEHPIVQTGMGWVAGPRLVTATAEAGGLGILASATMTFDELAKAIAEVKSRTSRPFGVNLRADAADASDRVDLLIAEGVKVASFALAPKQEFIERLKAAGSALPNMAGTPAAGATPGMPSWSMPTLDPAELEKRIQELKTVQFWLEQNARMIGMTIQGLEVQRMTLSTLQGMNVSMDALRESLKARAEAPSAPPARPEPQPAQAAAGSDSDDAPADGAASSAADPNELINPMRWWDTLTQQFTHLASQAAQTVNDSVGESMDMLKQAQAKAATPASGPKAKGAAPRSGPARKPTGPAATRPRAAAPKSAKDSGAKPASGRPPES